MIKQLEELLDTIEILRILASEYKTEHGKCLCPFTRQRIAWEWHKAINLKRIRQREALDLADRIIPNLNAILA